MLSKCFRASSGKNRPIFLGKSEILREKRAERKKS
jgi:hypothetical protein